MIQSLFPAQFRDMTKEEGSKTECEITANLCDCLNIMLILIVDDLLVGNTAAFDYLSE
jgi:hypothetical protein